MNVLLEDVSETDNKAIGVHHVESDESSNSETGSESSSSTDSNASGQNSESGSETKRRHGQPSGANLQRPR